METSVAALGIQWRIHRMGIALHLDGSMSLVPHVRPPLGAYILVSGQFQNEDGAQTSGYRKVMVCLNNPLDTPSLVERMKLTAASM